MHFTHWRYLLVCVCLPLLPTLAAAGQFGILRGTVRLEDGVIYPAATVQVRVGEEAFTFKTDVDGVFRHVVPAGSAVITVGEATVQAEITPGEVNLVTLVARPQGIIVSVSSAEGLLSSRTMVAAYRAPEGGAQHLYGTLIAPEHFWFPTVPAEATAFSALLHQTQSGLPLTSRREWTFAEPSVSRLLTMPAMRSTAVSLVVLDQAGGPVAASPVWGSLRYTTQPRSFWDTEAPDENGTPSAVPLAGVTTDRYGRLALRLWPGQRYELVLSAADRAGVRVPLAVDENGQATLERYTLTLGTRATVTHLVHDDFGKPVPRAAVTACYAWHGVMETRTAQADADGRVTWEHLPPVRVIVWGKGVSAGVLNARDTNLTAPLSPPIPEARMNYRFRITNPGELSATLSWNLQSPVRYRGQTQYVPGSEYLVYQPALAYPCVSGRLLELQVETKTKPFRLAYLTDLYLPFLDVDAEVEVPFALEADATREGEPDPEAEELPEVAL